MAQSLFHRHPITQGSFIGAYEYQTGNIVTGVYMRDLDAGKIEVSGLEGTFTCLREGAHWLDKNILFHQDDYDAITCIQSEV